VGGTNRGAWSPQECIQHGEEKASVRSVPAVLAACAEAREIFDDPRPRYGVKKVAALLKVSEQWLRDVIGGEDLRNQGGLLTIHNALVAFALTLREENVRDAALARASWLRHQQATCGSISRACH